MIIKMFNLQNFQFAILALLVFFSLSVFSSPFGGMISKNDVMVTFRNDEELLSESCYIEQDWCKYFMYKFDVGESLRLTIKTTLDFLLNTCYRGEVNEINQNWCDNIVFVHHVGRDDIITG
jgi:hypothetical protein